MWWTERGLCQQKHCCIVIYGPGFGEIFADLGLNFAQLNSKDNTAGALECSSHAAAVSSAGMLNTCSQQLASSQECWQIAKDAGLQAVTPVRVLKVRVYKLPNRS